MKKLLLSCVTLSMLMALCMPTALAYDYSFDSSGQKTDFYSATNYEDVFGGQYQYGGINLSDFLIPTIAYGYQGSTSTSTTQSTTTGVFDTSASLYPTYSTSTSYPDLWADIYTPTVSYTDTSTLLQSNGTLGTLSIPSLGIYAPIYEGTSDSSLALGVGHFETTSAWDGNVALCGHNRGATYVIGDIKDLNVGDIIQYSTSLGTRTYAVSMVCTISETDWTYLSATADNRLTLITCVENQSTLRWCVQAIQIA